MYSFFFIGPFTSTADIMGLYKQYFRITQHALGIRRNKNGGDGIALQMLISQPVNHGKFNIQAL